MKKLIALLIAILFVSCSNFTKPECEKPRCKKTICKKSKTKCKKLKCKKLKCKKSKCKKSKCNKPKCNKPKCNKCKKSKCNKPKCNKPKCNKPKCKKNIGKKDNWQSLISTNLKSKWKLAPHKKSTPKGINGNAIFKLKDGIITGYTAKPGVRNSFLITKKDYKNFLLKFEVKLQKGLNSGVQVRSTHNAKANKHRFFGPQVEIEYGGSAGYVYGEAIKNGGKGHWLSSKRPKHNFFHNGWNKYRIKAVGNTITTWINGNKVTTLKSKKVPSSGKIGLQVHGIGKNSGPYIVQWKNLYIKELP